MGEYRSACTAATNCVEVAYGTQEDTSIYYSACAAGSCVEVAYSNTTGVVKVKDSKDLRLPNTILYFTEQEWMAFIQGVKENKFDLKQLKDSNVEN